MEKRAVTKSQKGRKAYVERKVGECFQWKTHGQCSKGDSCSFSHDIQASGKSRKCQRRKGRSSSPASHSKAKQTDGEGQKPLLGSGCKQENTFDKSVFHADSNSVKIRHVSSDTLPCVWITSLKKECVHGDKCHVPTCWGRRKAQQEVEERWCKGISCNIEGVFSTGLCISRFLSEKICATWIWKIGIETHRQILQGDLAPKFFFLKKIVKKGSIYPKVCASWAQYLRAEIRGKGHMRRLCTKKDAPTRQRGIWRKTFSSWRVRTKLFFAGTDFNETRGARIRCWFRSIDANDKQERIKLRRVGHSKEVQNPNSSVDCKRESAKPRGGTSVRSWLGSDRNCATTRGNACCSIAWQALRRSRILQKVGSAVKSHDWPQKGKASSARQTISYLLSFQGCLSILEAVRLLHRFHRNRWDPKQTRHLETELHQAHRQVQY